MSAQSEILGQLSGLEYAISFKPYGSLSDKEGRMNVAKARAQMKMVVVSLLQCHDHHFAIVNDGWGIAVSKFGAQCVRNYIEKYPDMFSAS